MNADGAAAQVGARADRAFPLALAQHRREEVYAPDGEHHVADGEFRHRHFVDASGPPHLLAVLLEDRGIDVVNACRAQRDHLELGQRGAYAICKTVKAD